MKSAKCRARLLKAKSTPFPTGFPIGIFEEFHSHLFWVTLKCRQKVIRNLKNSCWKKQMTAEFLSLRANRYTNSTICHTKKNCKKSFGGLLRNKAAEVRKKIDISSIYVLLHVFLELNSTTQRPFQRQLSSLFHSSGHSETA